MPLFTHALAVDWSSHSKPKRGTDSIWIAEAGQRPINIFTRHNTIAFIKSRIKQALSKQQRLIIGLDFAFGYPAGMAQAICSGNSNAKASAANWQDLWQYLDNAVIDGVENKNNRFNVAGKMNRAVGLPNGPFWGHPWQHKGRYENLDMYSPKDLSVSFANKRIVENRNKKAQAVFKLTGVGAVGSQTILGIAALHRLITDPDIRPHIAVWPFETQLSGDFSKPITLAEIYPSSHTVDKNAHKILDAAQVMAVAKDLYYWNQTGAIEDKLSAFGLSDTQRALVINEEGWILGQ